MADSVFLGRVTGPVTSVVGNVAVWADTHGTVLADGSSGGAFVSSITGTANQITASAATGAVTLSIPAIFIAPGSIQATTTVAGTGFIFSGGQSLTGSVANTTTLINGTTAQVLEIYNSTTNTDRATIGFSGNVLEIFTQATGGIARSVRIGAEGAASCNIRTGGTDRWRVDSSGNLIAIADNAYTIGATATTRPSVVHAATSVNAPLFVAGGTNGVTAGPFTTITSITVKGGLVTAITGS